MDDEFKQHMEDDLRMRELNRAVLPMSEGESPGLEGLTVEFYPFFVRISESCFTMTS